jgi:hypothetical protein
MDNTKYGKYIITKPKPPKPDDPPPPPGRSERMTNVMYVDDEYVKGAFYVEVDWFKKPSSVPYTGPTAHTHDWDEVWTFFGSNPDDPEDLGGEVEIYLGGEKHILTKSSLVFIPAGLEHAPMIFRRVDRPIIHFIAGLTKVYKYKETPK